MADSLNIDSTIAHVANVTGSVERVARHIYIHQVCSPGVCKAFLIDTYYLGLGTGCV